MDLDFKWPKYICILGKNDLGYTYTVGPPLDICFGAWYLYGEVCRIKGSSSYEPRFGRTGVFRDEISGSLHQKLAVFLRRHDKGFVISMSEDATRHSL